MAVHVTIEAAPESTFEAQGVGTPWNGWATPVITAEQVPGFAAWVATWAEETEVRVAPEGLYVREPEEEAVLLPPIGVGVFSLEGLGWTFEVVPA